MPTVQKEKMVKTFRKLSWEVMMMCIICKMFRKGLLEFKEYEFTAALTRTDNERVDTMEADRKYRHLTFGISRFKSSQDHFPSKGLRITQKRPEWRTQEEVKQLRRILLVLPSYHRYSFNLQLMLAKVIRFERFGRRRVVLRLGHRGNSFYFIYSGSVAITKDKDGGSAFIDSEPIILRKGVAFGEVALMKGSRRNATVVCMEDTELLAVDKEDFFANKLDVEQAKELKYRYDFFRSLDLFATWSDKLIENVVGRCKTEEFHHGQVIIWDSSKTASITFVSKGSCELLRLVELINCPSYHKWINQHTDHDQQTPTKSDPKTISRKRFEKIMVNSLCVLDPIYERAPLNHLPARLHEQQEEEVKFTLPPLTTEAAKRVHEQRRFSERIHEATITEGHSMMVSSPYGRIHKGFNAAVYLRIDELQEGDCLGLHQYLIPHRLQDQRRMVLVSKGTEIIKLKKERFDELADGATIAILRKMEHPYPTDDELCQIFLEQNRWKLFKRDLVNTLLDHQLVKPKRDLKIGDHSFIQFSMDLNQAGMLNLLSVSQAHQESSLHLEPMFIPVDGKGKISVEGLPGIKTRLIHGINIPRNKLEQFIQ